MTDEIAALRERAEKAEDQAKTAADDMWRAVIRADELEATISRRDEEVAALRARVEKAEAENARLHESLSRMLDYYGSKYDKEMMLKNIDELETISRARAALGQESKP